MPDEVPLGDQVEILKEREFRKPDIASDGLPLYSVW